MTTASTAQAIQFALDQKWSAAILENEKLLKVNDTDIDALNRLAYAYLKNGNPRKAKTFYKKVLTLDNAHPIAHKMIKRIDSTGGHITTSTGNPFLFLEEPGKTKIIILCKLAPFKVLFTLTAGEKVNLISRRFTIEARNNKKTYLGALPDDISHRLLPLINGGNEYEAYVNHVDKNELSLFIKETKRVKKFRTTASFISTTSNYTPFIREDLLQPETEFDPSELGNEEE